MATGINITSVNQIKSYAEKKEFEKALPLVREQDLTKSYNSQFVRICGEVFLHTKNYEECRRALLMAHRLAPEGNRVNYFIILLYLEVGEYELADKYYEQYVFNGTEEDGDESRYLQYMIARSKKESPEKLLEIMEPSHSPDMSDELAYEFMRIYAAMGNEAKMMEEYHYIVDNFQQSGYEEKAEALKASKDGKGELYCFPEKSILKADEDAEKEEAELLERDHYRMFPKEPEIVLMADDFGLNEESLFSTETQNKWALFRQEREEKRALKRQEREEKRAAKAAAKKQALEEKEAQVAEEAKEADEQATEETKGAEVQATEEVKEAEAQVTEEAKEAEVIEEVEVQASEEVAEQTIEESEAEVMEETEAEQVEESKVEESEVEMTEAAEESEVEQVEEPEVEELEVEIAEESEKSEVEITEEVEESASEQEESATEEPEIEITEESEESSGEQEEESEIEEPEVEEFKVEESEVEVTEEAEVSEVEVTEEAEEPVAEQAEESKLEEPFVFETESSMPEDMDIEIESSMPGDMDIEIEVSMDMEPEEADSEPMVSGKDKHDKAFDEYDALLKQEEQRLAEQFEREAKLLAEAELLLASVSSGVDDWNSKKVDDLFEAFDVDAVNNKPKETFTVPTEVAEPVQEVQQVQEVKPEVSITPGIPNEDLTSGEVKSDENHIVDVKEDFKPHISMREHIKDSLILDAGKKEILQKLKERR